MGVAELGGALDVYLDGADPRSFAGRAREVLSGGQYVTISGAANVVGSTVTEVIPGSIVVSLISGTVGAWYAAGIAMHNAGSNELVSVATRGTYVATSAGVLSGGQAIYLAGSRTVQGVAAVPNNSDFSGTQVGRTITAAASGTNLWTLVNFSF